MSALGPEKIHLFSGKGGVGKSTLAAATALFAASEGRRPIIVELGRASTTAKIFGVQTTEFIPTEVATNVFAMNMELGSVIENYIFSFVRVKRVATSVMRSDALRRFFDAAPAVHEVAILHKLKSLADSGEYDPILVDLESTGHALMFLRLPGTLKEIVSIGFFRKVIDSFDALLKDKSKTKLHLVTLAAQLPLAETAELASAIFEEKLVSLGSLFVNQVQHGDPDVLKLDPNRLSGEDRLLWNDEVARIKDVKETLARLEELAAEQNSMRCVHLEKIDGSLSVAKLAALGARMWSASDTREDA